MEWYEKFERVLELLTHEQIYTEVENYFPKDDIERFTNSLIAAYDLENEIEESETNKE